MAIQIIHPVHALEPSDLDAFLQRGWRPAGQSIYTADYLRADDDEIHGCLQVRLPLKDFTFKKRHRQLLKRNDARFRVVHQAPAPLPSEELRNVNRLYMRVHPEKSREDLEYNLIGETGTRILDTQLLKVYQRHRLVAFSYFDVGRKVMYTKAGIYDPEYRAHSLGTYTMLLEVRMALEGGFEYYYPGYFSPTFPAFDYKLDLGPMEYRDISTDQWVAYDAAPDRRPVDPLATNRDKLLAARKALIGVGIRADFREYPSFTGRFRPNRHGENLMLDAPLLLVIGHPLPLEYYAIVTYDPEKQRYRFDLVRSANLYDMRVQVMSQHGVPRFTTPVVIHRRLLETDSLPELVRRAGERR